MLAGTRGVVPPAREWNVEEPTSVERWLPIPGFSRYRVSDQGRVWSIERITPNRWGTSTRRPGCLLKQHPARDGYPKVNILSDDGQWVNRKIHILVLEVFVGPRPMGTEACHWDDDHLNARLDNLRWDTRSGNWSDRRRVARPTTGKTHVELSSDRRDALRRLLRST